MKRIPGTRSIDPFQDSPGTRRFLKKRAARTARHQARQFLRNTARAARAGSF